MKNTNSNSKTSVLAGLMKRINLGENPILLRNEARQLVRNLDPTDITEAEQALVHQGYSAQLVQQLSAIFVIMGLYKKQDENVHSSLTDDHILRKITVEHDLTRCFLADLKNLAKTIWSLDSLEDVSSEFRNLAHVITHLSIMKEHIEREEDIIFPYFLKQFGWVGLCQAAQNQHDKIRIDIDNLVGLVTSFNELKFDVFKAWLITITQRLAPVLLEHFSYEDELLYPVFLVGIDDVRTWEKIKTLCDEIGYCGAHA